MKLAQYTAALKEQERSGEEQLIVSVVKHKTAKIYGAAHVNITPEVAPLMAGYVAQRTHLLNSLKLASDSFFVTNTGKQILQISRCIYAAFDSINIGHAQHITCSKIRKFVTTSMRTAHPTVASVMLHNPTNADRDYMTVCNRENARSVFDKLDVLSKPIPSNSAVRTDEELQGGNTEYFIGSYT